MDTTSADGRLDAATAWLARHVHDACDPDSRRRANLICRDYERCWRLAQGRPVEMVPNVLCPSCKGQGFDWEHGLSALRHWAAPVFELRPQPKASLDQAPVSLSQALANIAYLLEQLGAEEAFAFLGDDDFHSVLLARAAPWLQVTAYDADERIVDAINHVAELHSMGNLSAVRYDALRALPADCMSRYDACYSDPPYSYTGITLFIDRCLSLLKMHAGAWAAIAVPFTPIPDGVRECIRDVQRHVLAAGCVIAEFRPAFKMSSHSLGIVSGLMRVEQLQAVPVLSDNAVDASLVYSHFY